MLKEKAQAVVAMDRACRYAYAKQNAITLRRRELRNARAGQRQRLGVLWATKMTGDEFDQALEHSVQIFHKEDTASRAAYQRAVQLAKLNSRLP